MWSLLCYRQFPYNDQPAFGHDYITTKERFDRWRHGSCSTYILRELIWFSRGREALPTEDGSANCTNDSTTVILPLDPVFLWWFLRLPDDPTIATDKWSAWRQSACICIFVLCGPLTASEVRCPFSACHRRFELNANGGEWRRKVARKSPTNTNSNYWGLAYNYLPADKPQDRMKRKSDEIAGEENDDSSQSKKPKGMKITSTSSSY